MVKIALIRPGSTAFDDEGRIKGCLDFPLSEDGQRQVHQTANELALQLEQDSPQGGMAAVYSGPCQSAQATATVIAKACNTKVKVADCMVNIDHGLWQGKLIDEVKRLQPRVYRHIQEFPESFSPPGGETIEDAKARVQKWLARAIRKHHNEVIGLVVPDPLASLVRRLLVASELGDLWKAEQDSGRWEWITLANRELANVS